MTVAVAWLTTSPPMGSRNATRTYYSIGVSSTNFNNSGVLAPTYTPSVEQWKSSKCSNQILVPSTGYRRNLD